MLTILALAGLTLFACGDKDGDDSGAGVGSDTGAAAEGSGLAAPLTELTNGECPEMATSGTSTFMSYDLERTATVLVPSPLPDGPMPVVFFFHGLMDPGQTPEPTEYMAEALDMQSLADEYGALVILPESPTMEMLGIEFFLWDIIEDGGADLALYDDLRTCAAQNHDIDLDRVIAMGFSGGALWTSVVISQRADTLAAAIEMSGGADVDAYVFDDLIARYSTPSWPLPVLLQSGGTTDVWPSTSLVIVDFGAATDTLETNLVADGSLVVRCEHTRGHTVTQQGYNLAVDWALGHEMGQPSPWASGDLGSNDDWCLATVP